MKKALITGITGQDGSYLAEFLLAKGYEVYGIIRRSSSFNTGRIDPIYEDPHVPNARLKLVYGDLNDASSLNHIIRTIQPDEIYNLGAQSHVRVSFDIPEYTADVTGLGAIRLLEAIRESGLTPKFYQASSSEMYGKVLEVPQRETTPFYPRSPYAAAKLYKAQKPVMEKKLAEQGLMLLYSVPWPPQGIYVKKPIASAADLKGVKWRAYSPATARIAELVGAQPVTIQAAELQQAMATGVVESYMSSGSTGYDSKTYEHIKYWYDTQAWLPKNAVIVNKAAFDALDAQAKQALLKAGADAEARGFSISRAKNDEYKGLLTKNGMNIVAPPAALTSDMKKVGDTMLKEWLEKAGPEGQALIDAYKKM